jgi:endonuclease/exonuclease/phosphatase family metal-dependent hydrolase
MMSKGIPGLVAGLILGLSTPVISQVSPLKVMTFNIRYNNPGDSIYSWQNREEMVIDVIRRSRPDVIGFQEALKDQVDDLEARLKDYSWSGVGRDDGKKSGEYSAIFYRNDRFEKRAGSTFWLSETPEVAGSRSWNAACNRIVTWIQLYDKSSDHLFYVFNTHFDHASELARVQSAKLLLRSVNRIAGKDPVIVTGDFNATDTSMAYLTLTQSSPDSSLKDTRKLNINISSEPSYTFIGFPFHPVNGEVIDFIFLKNDRNFRVKKYQIITDNKKGKYPSDHLPVLVEIGIL